MELNLVSFIFLIFLSWGLVFLPYTRWLALFFKIWFVTDALSISYMCLVQSVWTDTFLPNSLVQNIWVCFTVLNPVKLFMLWAVERSKLRHNRLWRLHVIEKCFQVYKETIYYMRFLIVHVKLLCYNIHQYNRILEIFIALTRMVTCSVCC